MKNNKLTNYLKFWIIKFCIDLLCGRDCFDLKSMLDGCILLYFTPFFAFSSWVWFCKLGLSQLNENALSISFLFTVIPYIRHFLNYRDLLSFVKKLNKWYFLFVHNYHIIKYILWYKLTNKNLLFNISLWISYFSIKS